MKLHIGLGTDHRGFMFKEQLKLEVSLAEYDIEWHDFGTFTGDRVDYPPIAQKVVGALQKKEIQMAVLFCGSGQGMAITANRHQGIYAGIAWNPDIARVAKMDDDVNVLSIPANYVNYAQVREMVEAWLAASFKAGIYLTRLELIDK